MDSLHVSSGQQQQQQQHHHQGTAASKASSRSASPCRLQQHHSAASPPPPLSSSSTAGNQQQQMGSHHKKTLSHGSVDSNKSDGVSHGGNRHHRHRSPTSSSSTPRTAIPTTDLGGGGTTTMEESTSHQQHHHHHHHHQQQQQQQQHLDESGAEQTATTLPNVDSSDLLLCYAPASYAISNGGGSSENVLKHHQPHQHAEEESATDSTPATSNSKTSASIEHLGNKIIRVRDLIRTEQKLRDDNVNEYLKLAANADKHQVQRIKAVFEKKNQKSAQVISQLQKKLDTYQKRMHELETHGPTASSHRPPREVLRDVGQGLKNVGGNIRDGITGFSGSVMSKPREFAHLIKNKFGSADNISQLSRPGTTGSEGSGTNGHQTVGSDQGDKIGGHHHGSATLPAILHSANSNASMGQSGLPAQKFPSEEGSECSSVTSESIERYHSRVQEGPSTQDKYNLMYKQLMSAQEELAMLRKKLESTTLQQEIQFLNSSLQEEKFKTDRLEEQINDLTELHQNEVENLKQAMADMEEKVQYQSEERLRDIHEILEHCQTKIQKMEHQALQQQQYVTLEGLDNSNARAFAVKLINVLLTVLQVILLLVATCAGIIMPFLRTRVRILTTVSIVLLGLFVLRQWPEVQDIGSHVMKRLKDMLDPVK